MAFFVMSFSLDCYNSNSFVNEERATTTETCGDDEVCMYYESKSISGFNQECSITTYCNQRKADTVFLKNTKCCSVDFCNAVSGQPGPDSSASSNSFGAVYALISLNVVLISMFTM